MENGESYGESHVQTERQLTEEQIDILELKETIDQLATANGIR